MSIQLVNTGFSRQALQGPSVLHSKVATKRFNSSTQSSDDNSAANTTEESEEDKQTTSSSDYMNSMNKSKKLYSARVMNFTSSDDPSSSSENATSETSAGESSNIIDANDRPMDLSKLNTTEDANSHEGVIKTPEGEEKNLQELARGPQGTESELPTGENVETINEAAYKLDPNFSKIA